MHACKKHLIDWMHSIGCLPDRWGDDPVIVNSFCNFYKQLEYLADVLVKMYGCDVGRTTSESWATLERANVPGLVCAAGGANTIWMVFALQKAKTLQN